MDNRDKDVTAVIKVLEEANGGWIDDTKEWNRKHASSLIKRVRKLYPEYDMMKVITTMIVDGKKTFHADKMVKFQYLLTHFTAIIESIKQMKPEKKEYKLTNRPGFDDGNMSPEERKKNIEEFAPKVMETIQKVVDKMEVKKNEGQGTAVIRELREDKKKKKVSDQEWFEGQNPFEI